MRILIVLLLIPILSFSQKIVSDKVSPISGKRQVVTSLESVFQMSAIQVSASADITNIDSSFLLSFFYSTLNISTDKKEDTTTKHCTILLLSGLKVNGKYQQTISVSGYTIISYSFKFEDFKILAKEDAKAFMVSTPKIENAEYELKGKYSKTIQKVVSLIIKKI